LITTNAVNTEERRGPEESSPAEPLVKIQLGEDQTEIEFLVDTGAAYSVLNEKGFELSNKRIKVVGVTANAETRPFFKSLTFKIGKQWVTHQFLYLLGVQNPC